MKKLREAICWWLLTHWAMPKPVLNVVWRLSDLDYLFDDEIPPSQIEEIDYDNTENPDRVHPG